MNTRIFFWSITSALAGFLFGFDTVVISGAEQTIQSLWGLSPGLHGMAMASALYGTVLGSLLGGWPTDRFGRKATLLWIGVLYVVGAWGAGWRPMFRYSSRRASSAAWASASRPWRRRCTSRKSRRRLSRAAGRHVSVQHRLRHPHRLRLQRAARGHRRRMPGAGCSASRRFRRFSTRCCALAFPKARAG